MFPNSDPSVISLIGALQVFFLFGFGLFCAPIFGKVGVKTPYACGAAIFSFSLFMTALCNEIWQLFLAQGLLFGVGCALSYHPWINLPAQFFKTRRATAIAIVVAGSSLGGVVFPIATQHMFEHIGFKKTNFVLASVSLVLLIPPFFMAKQRLKFQVPEKIIDLSPMTEFSYAFISLGFCCVILALFTPIIYITPYALYQGYDHNISFYLLSILNGASLIGRILPGIIGDRIGRMNVLMFCTTASGILCLALWLNVTNIGGAIAFSLLIGLFSGGTISLMSPVIAQISEQKAIPARVGLFFTTMAAPALVGTPISGKLLEKNGGNYDKLIIFTGVMFLGSLLFFIPARWKLRPTVLARI